MLTLPVLRRMAEGRERSGSKGTRHRSPSGGAARRLRPEFRVANPDRSPRRSRPGRDSVGTSHVSRSLPSVQPQTSDLKPPVSSCITFPTCDRVRAGRYRCTVPLQAVHCATNSPAVSALTAVISLTSARMRAILINHIVSIVCASPLSISCLSSIVCAN